MRKDTIKYISNSVIWLLLALMPLVLMLIYNLHNNNLVLNDYLNIFATDNNIIYTALNDTFGPNGYLPLVNSDLILYASYLGCITLLQIVVNILLFVPKLCIAWIDKLTNDIGGKNGTL